MTPSNSAATRSTRHPPARIGFQGAPGAFSEEAAAAACGAPPLTELVPFRENREVTAALSQGTLHRAVLPIENSIAGWVIPTIDAVLEHPSVHAVAEVVLPIHHSLLAVSGATLQSVRTVDSHPVALAQCRSFLEKHGWIEARAAFDTAGSAAQVAHAADPTRAAIASAAAARHYGLNVLAANIEDRGDNQTRFLVFAREPAVPAGRWARTFLIVTGDNRPGMLLSILQPLADNGLNLSSLSSRPSGVPWMYYFLLEFEHEGTDSRVQAACDRINAIARSVRIVGTFGIDRPNMQREDGG